MKHPLFKKRWPFSCQKERIVTVFELQINFKTMEKPSYPTNTFYLEAASLSFALQYNCMYTVCRDVDLVDEYATCFTAI